MNLVGWIKIKLHGPPDPVKEEVVHEIEKEISRLNGAAVELSQNVDSVKRVRLQRRNALDALLDETLEALRKEGR